MNSNIMHMLPTVHMIKYRNSVSTNGSTVFEEQSCHALRNNEQWYVIFTSDVTWTAGQIKVTHNTVLLLL